jgi:DNA-binding NtrC family response regulator
MNASILIVDDNESVLAALTAAIRQLRPDWKPLTAVSCDEARKICRAMIPASVVLDVNLPDGNGFDLLHEFRDLDPRLPVIMTSGDEGNFTPERRNGHPYRIIAKPFDPLQLVESLEREINSACLVCQGEKPSPPQPAPRARQNGTALARRFPNPLNIARQSLQGGMA